MSGPGSGILAELTRIKKARSARVSSWNHSGRNHDYWSVLPGETAVLADLEGPGCITHIWMTQDCRRSAGLGVWATDPDFYRKLLLKIYWDDQSHPSVLAPLGDFFCIGHSLPSSFASIPFTVSVNKGVERKFGSPAALNCYLQMPFSKRARIEIVNEIDVPYRQFFYIDYELYDEPLDPGTLYFHAHWRRENPCDGWGHDIAVNAEEADIPNLDGAGNYVILETEGAGHYIGCNLSVTNFQNTWWGEGDDMIFIDGETWPPSLHGTGSEDYFGQAFEMQKNAFPMCGSALWEGDVPGYQVSYRFHLVDPVRFTRSIKVTMEHGHANHLANEWASTAYWYQTLPGPVLDILPVEKRLPIRMPSIGQYPQEPPGGLAEVHKSEEMQRMSAQYAERADASIARRRTKLEEMASESRERGRQNIEIAKRLRDNYLGNSS